MKRPPFCPNRDCLFHQKIPENNLCWYYNDGYFASVKNPKTKRFKCKSCGKRFSTQSFSLDYALKKKGSFRKIFDRLKACSGIRDMARSLNIAPSSVLLRITRLARQSVAFHASMKQMIELNEDLVADGFESFAVSQYFPNNINILVGKESQYIYSFDYSHLRRKGRMTERQKDRNSLLQPQFLSGKTIKSSFTDLCHSLSALLWKSRKECIVLYTDEKKEYRTVLKRFKFPKILEHKTISSTAPRTVRNDLFSANYTDRQFRLCLAEHVRETMRFARNVNNSMERMAVYNHYHNYRKPFRINRSDDAYRDRIHAEVAGLSKEHIQKGLRTFFTKRLFFARVSGIDKQDLILWYRGYATPLNTTYQSIPAYVA